MRDEQRVAVTVMVGSAVFTLGEGSINVLLAPLLEARGLSASMIGAIVACFSLAALASRPLIGNAFTRGRAGWILGAGGALAGAAFIGLSVAQLAWSLTLFVILKGVAYAVVSTGGLATIMGLGSRDDAGTTMGWYTGAVGAGYAMAGFIGGAAGDYLGLDRAVAVLAIVPAFAGFVLWITLRPRSVERIEPVTLPVENRVSLISSVKSTDPIVWLSFVLALHINLLGGVLTTFFPLYGLASGLTLTQVGMLTGLHSGVSSSVRFLAPWLFRYIQPERVNTPLVLLGSFAVAALALGTGFATFAVSWTVIGFSRGLLRVTSAASAMRGAAEGDQARGSASGVYLAGLDVGKILGPVMGGAVVAVAGFEVAFLATGLFFPLVYLFFRRRLNGLSG